MRPTKIPTIMAARIMHTARARRRTMPTRMVTMVEAAAAAATTTMTTVPAVPAPTAAAAHHRRHPAVVLPTAPPIRHLMVNTMTMNKRTILTILKAILKVILKAIVTTIIYGNEMTTMITTTRPVDTGLPTRISRLVRIVVTMTTIGMPEVKRYNTMMMQAFPTGMASTRTKTINEEVGSVKANVSFCPLV